MSRPIGPPAVVIAPVEPVDAERNLHLYERLGYRERRRRVVSPRLTLVFLEKQR